MNVLDSVPTAAAKAPGVVDLFSDITETLKNMPHLLSQRLGDVSNDAAFRVLLECARVTGGKLGKLSTLAGDVDDAFAARSGSKEVNLSAANRIAQNETMQGGEPSQKIALPSVRDEAEVGVAVAAVYETLSNAGIDQGVLNSALSIRNDEFSTLQAFGEIASDAKLQIEGLDDYLSGIQRDFGKLPEVAANEPDFDQPAVNDAQYEQVMQYSGQRLG